MRDAEPALGTKTRELAGQQELPTAVQAVREGCRALQKQLDEWEQQLGLGAEKQLAGLHNQGPGSEQWGCPGHEA